MIANRAVQQSMRRLALQPTRSGAVFNRFASPIAIATNNAFTQKRYAVTTESLSDSQAQNEILAQQRLKRPVSPHLTIYRPQITWIPSMLNRLTGIALSGPLYLFSIAYLVAPAAGWHLETASIAAAFAGWPVFAQFLTKFVVSLPFTFHSVNGIRHLVWDMTKGLTNKQVIRTGWAAVGATFAGSLLLALI